MTVERDAKAICATLIMQPKIGDLAAKALGIVASLGGGLVMFLFSFVVAGIIMAFGEAGAAAMLRIFERIAGLERGADLARLSTATVRAVASGVIGIACIQALLVGVCLLLAGIPFAVTDKGSNVIVEASSGLTLTWLARCPVPFRNHSVRPGSIPPAKATGRCSTPGGGVGRWPGRSRWSASITSRHTGAAPLVPETARIGSPSRLPNSKWKR